MKIIYKYPVLVTDDEQIIEMPADAIILNAQVQYGAPQVWALVPLMKINDNEPPDRYDVRVLSTGIPADFEDFTYLSTFQLFDGAFIGHVFYKKL